MNHRYLRWTWWIRRLAGPAEHVIPSAWVMRALVFAAQHDDEPELAMLSMLVPMDRTAVDVGAADGIYTWCLTRLCERCVAFEANPSSAARVRDRVPEATVRALAVSDETGKAELRVPRINGVMSTGLATIEAENALDDSDDVVVIETLMCTLDSCSLSNVGFIKIDVEGHELAVLEGAENILQQDRPILLIEVEDRHRPGARESVVKWLRTRNYQEPVVTSAQNLIFRPVPAQ